MKTKIFAASLVLVTGIASAIPAQAAGKIYVGAKLGVVDADINGFDNAYTAGVYGGFNLLGKDSQFGQDLKGGTLSVEGETMLTAIKGNAGLAGDWDITSLGLYAAYRHELTNYFYLKAKAGIVRYDIGVDIPAGPVVAAATGTETKLAAGIGAGWKVGPGNIEAELVTYEGDILQLSAGFHMSF